MPEKPKSKEIIDPKSIVITTSTFYPNWNPEKASENPSTTIRGKLAIETIREAIENGYQMVVVDGGSGNLFTLEAESLGAIVFNQDENGMSPGRRQAFREAAKLSEAKVICWTEPEKISIVKDCLPDAIFPIINKEADIVVPSRNDASFSTYPDYQVRFEKTANRLWNKVLRRNKLLPDLVEDIDVWFGPKFFRNDPKILSLFLARYNLKRNDFGLYKEANPEDWANATMLPVVAALNEGYKVKTVSVPYRHPPEQTQLEQTSEAFYQKREFQLKTILAITVEFVKFIKGDPKSLISSP